MLTSAPETSAPETSAAETSARKIDAWLRILATSDVHAHLRGYDYARNVHVEDWGLTRLATRIAAARQEAPVSILLDNGDFLQGTPLAQLFSDPTHDGQHPVLEAMETMRYDAVGLGNHEFNYGLERLKTVLSRTTLPVLCANLLRRTSERVEDDDTLFPARLILTRKVVDTETGDLCDLRIGLLSVLPSQVMKWDGAHLKGRVGTRDMTESASWHVAKLRADGADIVIVMAHTGIDPQGTYTNAENAAVALARIPGVTALITGHTHCVFPDPSFTQGPIDGVHGTIHGIPTVMPGYRGSHLGVIDLHLRRGQAGWHVTAHDSRAVPAAGAAEDAGLCRVVDRAHQVTLAHINQTLGRTSRPIHSYLSHVRDDLSTRLVAMAQHAAIEEQLAGTDHAEVPLLSASAPYQTGGRAGPMAFVDIPSGPLAMRDANSLYPFPNTLCAVRATGADVVDWLERAASAFQQIVPGMGEQRLLNPAFPGHAIDTLYGLRYRIDLTQPPAFDVHGHRLLPQTASSRIGDLTHNGRPVLAEDVFVVAVNGYRAYGGGPYAPVSPERLLLQTDACALRSVVDFLASDGADRVGDDPCWSFLPVQGASATFETGPGFAKHTQEMERFCLRCQGSTQEGFVRVNMPLDRSPCESAA